MQLAPYLPVHLSMLCVLLLLCRLSQSPRTELHPGVRLKRFSVRSAAQVRQQDQYAMTEAAHVNANVHTCSPDGCDAAGAAVQQDSNREGRPDLPCHRLAAAGAPKAPQLPAAAPPGVDVAAGREHSLDPGGAPEAAAAGQPPEAAFLDLAAPPGAAPTPIPSSSILLPFTHHIKDIMSVKHPPGT